MFQENLRILVRMPNWLGDAVMATPILQDLKEHWPHAHLTALCQGSAGQLLAGNPFVDEVLSFQKQDKKTLLQSLKKNPFDLGILLTNSFSSAWMLWRGNIKKRLGYTSDARSFFLTDPIPFPKEKGKEHLVITYKKLLLPLGIPLSSTSPSLYVSPAEKIRVHEIRKQYGVTSKTLVGINPGAAYGSAKCWLPERFREVAKKLIQEHEVAILFFGDKTGEPLVREICQGLPPEAINLAGKTSLRELIALIQACSAFLTNDSGPMHIAAALKTPLVAVFGSTNEVATGPYEHGTVIHKHVECSPCYKRTCPIDFRCMTRIESDEVYNALQRLLRN